MANDRETKRVKRLLKATPRGSLRSLVDGAAEVFALQEQLLRAFATEDASLVFAEPTEAIEVDGGRVIRWSTPLSGDVRWYGELDEEGREELIRAVGGARDRMSRFLETAVDIDASDRGVAAQALVKALEVPSLACLAWVGGRPVIVDWGFVEDRWDAPRGLIERRLAELAPPPEPEAPPEPEPPPPEPEVPPPSDDDPEGGSWAIAGRNPAGDITLKFRDRDTGLWIIDREMSITVADSRTKRVLAAPAPRTDNEGGVSIGPFDASRVTLNISGTTVDGTRFSLRIPRVTNGTAFIVHVFRAHWWDWSRIRIPLLIGVGVCLVPALIALLIWALNHDPMRPPVGGDLVIPDGPTKDFRWAEGEWRASDQLVLRGTDVGVDLVFTIRRGGVGTVVYHRQDHLLCETPITLRFRDRVLTLAEDASAPCRGDTGGEPKAWITRIDYTCVADSAAVAKCGGKADGADEGRSFRFRLIREPDRK